MDGEAAARAAATVGIGSGAVGLGLLARPGPASRVLGLSGDGAMRLIGLADLALAPGLTRSGQRWPWMLGRAGLNVAIARHLLARRSSSTAPWRPLVAAALLGAVTTADLRIAAALRAVDA